MKISVAVTGLNASDNPGPGLGLIRSLRAWPQFEGRVIGLAYDAREAAIYLPEACDAVYLIPYPSSGVENLWRRLEYVLERERVDCIVPCLDSELAGFIALEPRLAKRGVKMLLPTTGMLDLREKRRLPALCRQAKVAHPRTREVNSPGELARAAHEIGFPVVVKGVFYDAVIANTLAEADAAAATISSRWGYPLGLQELIRGEEFDVALVGAGGGKIAGLVAMKKMQLTAKGKAWGGVTLDAAPVLPLVKKLVRALDWRGPMEIEVMRRASDGTLFLIEINPRFPAWIFLSQGAGCNLPALLLESLFGKPRRGMAVGKPGTTFLRVAEDRICAVEDLERMSVHGELTRER